MIYIYILLFISLCNGLGATIPDKKQLVYDAIENCNIKSSADQIRVEEIAEEIKESSTIAKVKSFYEDGKFIIVIQIDPSAPEELLTAAIYHECGHIANGDLDGYPEKFVMALKTVFFPINWIAPDLSNKYLEKINKKQEIAADIYACDVLISLNFIDALTMRMAYFMVQDIKNVPVANTHPSWKERYTLIKDRLVENKIDFCDSFSRITNKYPEIFSRLSR